MAVSQVSICNSALIKIGADVISSITQETRTARLLNAVWNQVSDAVLRDHRWNFAVKRVTLAPNGTTPDWGYDYQYDIPNDSLRILDVDPDDIEYVIEGSKILSDESELDILYIYRNTDPSSWDAMFAEALAWKLAETIAYAVTQSKSLVDSCRDSYKAAIANARFVDGSEGTPKVLVADVWSNARK